MRAISSAAGGGPNFIQQMLNADKAPAVDKFLSVMNALGDQHLMYVLTGQAQKSTKSPEAALRSAMLAYGVDAGQLDLALGIIGQFVRAEVGVQPAQTPSDDLQQPANPHRGSAPSGKKSQQPSS
ncbi:hypothetical protein [Metarhizobium album]|nr:hypothetical protein [Rhizobium album]